MAVLRRLRAALLLSLGLHVAVLLAPLLPAGPPGPTAGRQARLDAVLREATPRHPPAVEPVSAADATGAVPPPAFPTATTTPGAAAPGGGATIYFAASEVDVPAKLQDGPDMVIPQDAYNKRTPGRVRLLLYINAGGTVDFVELVAAEPQGVYDEIVIRAATQSRYAPAQRFGRTVASRKSITVEIEPYQTIARP
jgi:protein TonB